MPTSPSTRPTPSTRLVCRWTCPRSDRSFTLYRRGRTWLLAWASDTDWGEGMGKSIPEVFVNAGIRAVPRGFPYRGSGCARRRVSRAVARG
jgi:hypothetical protein